MKMKIKYLLILFLVIQSLIIAAQQDETIRYIEVKGEAEIEIEPDEIKYVIGIEEYWEEEFEKKKEFKDYKTKVALSDIEDELIKNLRKVGIDKKDVTVNQMGNYSRFRGKEFLYSKQLIVKITDFSRINALTQIMDAKGIKYMNIGELNHSKMEDFKKQVKIDALKNAKEKAQYLVESIDEELGEVISIEEMSDGYSRPVYATAMMRSADMAQENIDEVEKITISYQVRAKFSIK
jgi:hypothetical protein